MVLGEVEGDGDGSGVGVGAGAVWEVEFEFLDGSPFCSLQINFLPTLVHFKVVFLSTRISFFLLQI